MREEKERKRYADVESVRRMKNQLIPEEFPEGSYGSNINKEQPVQAKSTPWQPGQYRESAFVYPDKDQHDDIPRQIDGAHPLHDEDDA